MIGCRVYGVELSAYVDGELDLAAERFLERHVEHCADCASALATLRRLEERLEALPQFAPSRQFEARLWAAVDALEPQARASRPSLVGRLVAFVRDWRPIEWALVPVAIVLAVVLYTGGDRRGQPALQSEASSELPYQDWALVADAESFELILSDDHELLYSLDDLEAASARDPAERTR